MQQPKHDIRLEFFLAQNETNLDNTVIHPLSAFNRSHKKDIESIKEEEEEDKLNIKVNRIGLYDCLPESLFHTPPSAFSEVSHQVRLKQQQQEEQDARHFFLPFEQENYRLGVFLASQEETLFGESLDEKLVEFWGISPELNKTQQKQLAQIMPLLPQIVGNYKLTSYYLSLLLEEQVVVNDLGMSIQNKFVESSHNKPFGTMQLGKNWALGQTLEHYYPSIEIQIQGIKTSSIKRYFLEEQLNNTIRILARYFFPIDVSWTLDIELEVQDDFGLFLSDEKENYLGYATSLNR